MLAHHEPIFEGISALIGSVGVLTTGLAAVISAILSTRSAKKRATDDCDRRIAELEHAFREGIKIADQRPKVRKR